MAGGGGLMRDDNTDFYACPSVLTSVVTMEAAMAETKVRMHAYGTSGSPVATSPP
jgi:hypothetical protein